MSSDGETNARVLRLPAGQRPERPWVCSYMQLHGFGSTELRSELWVHSLEERGRLWRDKNHQDQAAASRTSKAFRFLTTMSYMCMVLKLAKSWGKEMRSNVLELL